MSLIYREKSARQRPVRHPRLYPRHHETRLRSTIPGTRVLSFSINQVEEPKYKPPRRFFSRPPVVHLHKAPQVPFIEAGGLDWTLPLLPEKTLPSRNEIKSLYLVSPPLSNKLGESGDEGFPSSGPSTSRSSSSYNPTQRQAVMSKQIRQSLWATSTRSTSTRI
ncbi:hypothetical protein FRC18_006447 [Serendipita sp. 400]|nr:hypothetical protein FRC18_006447 [Serendipita sp. 400]